MAATTAGGAATTRCPHGVVVRLAGSAGTAARRLRLGVAAAGGRHHACRSLVSGHRRQPILVRADRPDHRELGPDALVHRPPWRASRPALGGSEEHTSELQPLMRISYAVFC